MGEFMFGKEKINLIIEKSIKQSKKIKVSTGNWFIDITLLVLFLILGLSMNLLSELEQDTEQKVKCIYLIVGSMFTFFTSYFINRINACFSHNAEKMKNTNLIIVQLEYTYEVLYNPDFKVQFKGLILDESWFNQLSNSNFKDDEKAIIFNWFKVIRNISLGYGAVEGKFLGPITCSIQLEETVVDKDDVKKVFERYYTKIKEIIKNYKI